MFHTTRILTAAQMKRVDQRTTEECGLPGIVLMENAAFNLYWALREHFEHLEDRRIAVVCGKGNNGGDGLALARQLVLRGLFPDVLLLSRFEDVRGDARTNLEILNRSGYPVRELPAEYDWRAAAIGLNGYDIIVDAILGTGITEPLKGYFSRVVEEMNRSGAFVLSVDIPSGMPSDALAGGFQTVKADLTVTFTAPKIAHILNEDQEALGDLVIVPIGTPASLMEDQEFFLHLMTREWARHCLPVRRVGSHKGTFGHVAVIAGATGKAGAAALCAASALRTGSGLVTALCPDAIQPQVAGFRPEIMTEGLPSTAAGTFSRLAAEPLLKGIEEKDAAALGPGLSTDPETVEVVHQLVRESSRPLVIDADGLNSFSGQLKKLRNSNSQPLILTPHPGEFSRLIRRSIAEIARDRISLVRDFARRHGVWLVLKSFRTLVGAPDGRVFACPLGNPGMATAGMGDVLTGMLASLVGTCHALGRTSPEELTEAVVLAVFVHSMAGDIAAEQTGPEALTAGDTIDSIGTAFRTLHGLDE